MNPAQSKDPFEAAVAAGQPETPPDSPLADDDHEPVLETAAALDDDDDTAADAAPVGLDSSVPASGSAEAGPSSNPGLAAGGKEEEEEEEEHMDVELSKLPSGDPDKTAKMQWDIFSLPYCCVLGLFLFESILDTKPSKYNPLYKVSFVWFIGEVARNICFNLCLVCDNVEGLMHGSFLSYGPFLSFVVLFVCLAVVFQAPRVGRGNSLKA